MSNRKTLQQNNTSNWLMMPNSKIVLAQRQCKMYDYNELVINTLFFLGQKSGGCNNINPQILSHFKATENERFDLSIL